MSRRNRNLKFEVPVRRGFDGALNSGEAVAESGRSAKKWWDRGNSFDVISDVSVDKSSSSSLSWGEECEHEATRLVKSEYERMQRVLKGLEAIPPNYDKDEYKLWIKTFPCLRSTDAVTKPSKPKIDAKKNRDSSMRRENKTVIDVDGTMCTKLTQTSEGVATKRGTKRIYPLVKDMKIDNFLTISPAITTSKAAPSNNPRFTQKFNLEYSSYLPIVSRSNDVSAKAKTRSKRNSRVRNSKFDCAALPANHLVLPPIDIHCNQFRSISAMPLQQTKSTSAISTKTNVNFDYKMDVNEKVVRRNCKNVKFYCK